MSKRINAKVKRATSVAIWVLMAAAYPAWAKEAPVAQNLQLKDSIAQAVPDTVAPTLRLKGGNPLVFQVGSSFVDPGVVAYDDRDGDISASVQVTGGSVDTTADGVFTLTYNVSDAAGNAAVAISRLVSVSGAHTSASMNTILAEIVPTEASASSSFVSYTPTALINASGMKNRMHNNDNEYVSGSGYTYTGGSTWKSDQSPSPSRANPSTPLGSAWLQFVFDSPLVISQIDIWNYNKINETESGVKDLQVSYSEDGVTWNNLAPAGATAHTVPEANGQMDLPASLSIQTQNIVARYVVLTATSNYGGNFYGLSEVMFQSSHFKVGQSYFGPDRFVEYIVGDAPLILGSPHDGNFIGNNTDPIHVANHPTLADIPIGHTGLSRDGNSQAYARQIAVEFKALTEVRPHLIINHILRRWWEGVEESSNPHINEAYVFFNSFIEIAKARSIERWDWGFYMDCHTRGGSNPQIDLGYGLSGSTLTNSINWSNAQLSTWNSTLHLRDGVNLQELLRGETSLGGQLTASGYTAIPSPSIPTPGDTYAYFIGGKNPWRHGSGPGSFGERIAAVHTEVHFSYINSANKRLIFAKAVANAFKVVFENHYGFHVIDPPAGKLQFAAATYSQVEGNSGTSTVTIAVSRTGGSSGAVSVNYASSSGTATAGSDYNAASGTLNWADGDTANKTFTMTIIGDTAVESDETVNLTLSGNMGGATLGTNSTAVLTIILDDIPSAGTLQFAAAAYSQMEGNSGTSTVTIAVSRTGGSSGSVSVNYASNNGTAIAAAGSDYTAKSVVESLFHARNNIAAATAGSDHTAASGTLNWADGDTANKTFTMTIIGDTAVEENETVTLTLSAPSGGPILGTPSTTVLTITNDDVDSPVVSDAGGDSGKKCGLGSGFSTLILSLMLCLRVTQMLRHSASVGSHKPCS